MTILARLRSRSARSTFWLPPAAGVLVVLAACAHEPATVAGATPPRSGPFGSLRDFVLFERAEGRGPSIFVDRFEVTRADWNEFAATDAGRAVDAGRALVAGDPALPVGSVDLRQARAFATWRFARLPRGDEWAFVAVGDGRSPSLFPWGSKEDATRANTTELCLGEPTPVGTFESGRRAGSDQPYDLVGNVSEWTESVPSDWFRWRPRDGSLDDAVRDDLDPAASCSRARKLVLRTPALAVWQQAGGVVPLLFVVQAGGDLVPREVVGADFNSSMTSLAQSVPAGDRRTATGLRVCASPRELLHALATRAVQVREQDVEQLRRFVQRGRHHAVLAAVWPAVKARLGGVDSSVARLLVELLEPADAANGGR